MRAIYKTFSYLLNVERNLVADEKAFEQNARGEVWILQSNLCSSYETVPVCVLQGFIYFCESYFSFLVLSEPFNKSLRGFKVLATFLRNLR